MIDLSQLRFGESLSHLLIFNDPGYWLLFSKVNGIERFRVDNAWMDRDFYERFFELNRFGAIRIEGKGEIKCHTVDAPLSIS